MEMIQNEENQMLFDMEQRKKCINKIELFAQNNSNKGINNKSDISSIISVQNSHNNTNDDFQFIAILDEKYGLIQKIGEGSTSKIYLGYPLNNENSETNLCSIKILKSEKLNVEMFNSEVSLLKSIKSENVLHIYDHGKGKKIKSNGKSKEVYYIIMELMQHGDLIKYISNISPNSNENIGFGENYARLIFAQLLDGLEAIHNSDAVHRDIKPDNIMIGNDYKLKYVDLGFSTKKSNILLKQYLGTPAYAAPEIHIRRPYLGEYSDIFSLGVTLFVLVTGSLPFRLPVPNDMLYQFFVRNDYIGFWRQRKVKVSISFMQLFDNLVAFDYSQRPSISEIRESSWMKEINWDLMPYLKQELILREKIIIERKNEEYLRQLREKQEKDNKIFENNFSLLETKKQIRNYGNIKNNLNNTKDNDFNEKNIINNCKINNNINPNKIIINLEDINNSSENKESINQIGNDEIIVESSEDKKVNENIDFNEKIDENGKNHKKELTGGFIPIQIESKNLNIAMTKIKKYLKNKGYFPIRRNFNDLELIISDGEVDILLKIEKFKKDYTKLSYFKLKGIITQFDLFRKEIQSLKNKLL